MKAAWWIFFGAMLFSISAYAEPVLEKRNGAIWVKSATTHEVERLFEEHGFRNFSEVRMKFPRIYLTKLPTDWQEIPQTDNKNRIFIRILLPLVLKVNEALRQERAEIEKINEKFEKDGKISVADRKLLEEKAKKYDVFTRMDGDTRISILLTKLLLKIGDVPPSIMIVTAAIYTDWGMSRLAVEANSLYREEIWYQKEGLKPLDDENAEYRYKIFANLEDCIASRALQLNSHINYDYFREARQMSRAINRPPFGQQLAAKMMQDSNLHNIAGMIDYTFTYYRLIKTDYFPELEDVK
ncbi:MAG: glucosaminidase domain-containing protein [Alphaproteobacteria bacterium]|nr:glucosaminidase domain-containing protein [Alphaproteobacteria bacterium]